MFINILYYTDRIFFGVEHICVLGIILLESDVLLFAIHSKIRLAYLFTVMSVSGVWYFSFIVLICSKNQDFTSWLKWAG